MDPGRCYLPRGPGRHPRPKPRKLPPKPPPRPPRSKPSGRTRPGPADSALTWRPTTELPRFAPNRVSEIGCHFTEKRNDEKWSIFVNFIFPIAQKYCIFQVPKLSRVFLHFRKNRPQFKIVAYYGCTDTISIVLTLCHICTIIDQPIEPKFNSLLMGTHS